MTENVFQQEAAKLTRRIEMNKAASGQSPPQPKPQPTPQPADPPKPKKKSSSKQAPKKATKKASKPNAKTSPAKKPTTETAAKVAKIQKSFDHWPVTRHTARCVAQILRAIQLDPRGLRGQNIFNHLRATAVEYARSAELIEHVLEMADKFNLPAKKLSEVGNWCCKLAALKAVQEYL